MISSKWIKLKIENYISKAKEKKNWPFPVNKWSFQILKDDHEECVDSNEICLACCLSGVHGGEIKEKRKKQRKRYPMHFFNTEIPWESKLDFYLSFACNQCTKNNMSISPLN